ncbi:hypothetical protein K3712_000537 [Escherichia coli]|nr:hypothetical protein [Escherichia coli]
MALHPPFQKGNTFGKGRPKGSKNKKTIERTEQLRQFLEDNNFLIKMASQVLKDYEGEDLKSSEATNAFEKFAKYLIQTTAQDQDDEQIEILDRATAEQAVNRINQRLDKIIPKSLEDEEEE